MENFVEIGGVRYGVVNTSVEGDHEVSTYLVEEKWFSDNNYTSKIGRLVIGDDAYGDEVYSNCVGIEDSGYKYIEMSTLHAHSL